MTDDVRAQYAAMHSLAQAADAAMLAGADVVLLARLPGCGMGYVSPALNGRCTPDVLDPLIDMLDGRYGQKRAKDDASAPPGKRVAMRDLLEWEHRLGWHLDSGHHYALVGPQVRALRPLSAASLRAAPAPGGQPGAWRVLRMRCLLPRVEVDT